MDDGAEAGFDAALSPLSDFDEEPSFEESPSFEEPEESLFWAGQELLFPFA